MYRNERGGACSTRGEKKYVWSSDGKPEGKTLFGRPGNRWEGSIEMYLREIGCESVDCIHLARDGDKWRAVVNTVMNLDVL
jgi:hypothetical protein